MASPVFNGWGASMVAPAAAMAASSPGAAAAARPPSTFASAPSSLGVGLLVALFILAYWYRRVL